MIMGNRVLNSIFLIPAMIHPMIAGAKKTNNTGNDERPNVIIILADDLGYGDLSCYGAKNIVTPHVDRLADSGIRFTNGHAVASTSTPSRYSLLTGEYAWRRKDTDVAAGDAAMIIRPSQFTLADAFKAAGYSTAAIGKWHLGLGDKTGEQDWNAPLPQSLGDLGFDYHYIMAATADRVPCVFIENGQVANYDKSDPIQVSYKENFKDEPTGASNPELLYNQRPSHGHNMSIVNGISRIGYMKGGGTALWKDENIADSIVAHAVGFMQKNKSQPFFMYLATNDIHVPRFPHQRFRGKNIMGLRGDAIAQFDWTVGQITEELRKLGIEKNTLIILTSDNGPVVDDGYDDRAAQLLNGHKPAGPFRGNKYSAFEGGTSVPFIVSWPNKIKDKQTSNALLSQVDLLSTLSSLMNITIPKGNNLDGTNYLNTLMGNDSIGRPYVIEQSSAHVLSVRTARWKFIEANDGPAKIPWGPDVETGNSPTPQLYDLRSDNFERLNVADEHATEVFDFQKILREERAKTTAIR